MSHQSVKSENKTRNVAATSPTKSPPSKDGSAQKTNSRKITPQSVAQGSVNKRESQCQEKKTPISDSRGLGQERQNSTRNTHSHDQERQNSTRNEQSHVRDGLSSTRDRRSQVPKSEKTEIVSVRTRLSTSSNEGKGDNEIQKTSRVRASKPSVGRDTDIPKSVSEKPQSNKSQSRTLPESRISRETLDAHSTADITLDSALVSNGEGSIGRSLNSDISSPVNYSLLEFRAVDYNSAYPDARATMHVGPDPCGCYPRTSSNTLPSMRYDAVRCVHNGNLGFQHEGVFYFDDGWDSDLAHAGRLKTQQNEKRVLVHGYPRPLFDQWSEISSVDSEPLTHGSKHTLQSGSIDARSGINTHVSEMSGPAPDVNNPSQIPPGSKSLVSGIISEKHTPGSRTGALTSDKSPIVLFRPDSEFKSLHSKRNNEKKDKPGPGSNHTVTKTPPGSSVKVASPGAEPEHNTDAEPGNLQPQTTRTMFTPEANNKTSTIGSRQHSTMSSPVSARCEITTPVSIKQASPRRIKTERNFTGKYYDPVTDRVYKYQVNQDFGDVGHWTCSRKILDPVPVPVPSQAPGSHEPAPPP